MNEITKRISKLLRSEFNRRFCIHGKYTEVQFAKDIGLQKDTMHSYLDGSRTPNAETLIKISKGLNISVDYLLGLSDVKHIEPIENTKYEETINSLISQLDATNEYIKNIEQEIELVKSSVADTKRAIYSLEQ